MGRGSLKSLDEDTYVESISEESHVSPHLRRSATITTSATMKTNQYYPYLMLDICSMHQESGGIDLHQHQHRVLSSGGDSLMDSPPMLTESSTFISLTGVPRLAIRRRARYAHGERRLGRRGKRRCTGSKARAEVLPFPDSMEMFSAAGCGRPCFPLDGVGVFKLRS